MNPSTCILVQQDRKRPMRIVAIGDMSAMVALVPDFIWQPASCPIITQDALGTSRGIPSQRCDTSASIYWLIRADDLLGVQLSDVIWP